MDRPDVSIIIPNCGNSRELPRAIESIQKCSSEIKKEVIVVDNDGIDRQDLPQKGIDLEIIHEDSQPPGHNRNVGIERSSGRYIVFCDADDEILSLRHRFENAEMSGFSVVVGDPVYRSKDETRHICLGLQDSPFREYLCGGWVPVVGCPLLDRDVVGSIRFPEFVGRAQDFGFWCKVFYNFDVWHIPYPVYMYFQSCNQRARNSLVERYRCQRKICIDLLKSEHGLCIPLLYRLLESSRNELIHRVSRYV